MPRYAMLGAMLLASACAGIKPATMRLPAGLDLESRQFPFTGIGGGTRGTFAVGAYHGKFERSEQRLALFDAVEKNYGHADYVMRLSKSWMKGPGTCQPGQTQSTLRRQGWRLELRKLFEQFALQRATYTLQCPRSLSWPIRIAWQPPKLCRGLP